MGDLPAFAFRDEPGRVILFIRVTPRASRDALSVVDGQLRARLRAAPVDGAANTALIALLADRFGVRRSDISVLRGATAREKQVAIAGLSGAALHPRLDPA